MTKALEHVLAGIYLGDVADLEQRVEAFRALLFEGISKALRERMRAMDYEGALSLHWPSYLHTHAGRGSYRLSMSCSVLGKGRHYTWTGKTWRDVFRKAESDVREWIAEIPTKGE